MVRCLGIEQQRRNEMGFAIAREDGRNALKAREDGRNALKAREDGRNALKAREDGRKRPEGPRRRA